ncbi:hypothetical protein [Microlunatus parietis]|uniref:Uncharacterized protein n=1 Tax=Microlunatus parietis TaxID=682979 RepID=A0A7Y9IDG0_9ACTN|nr:hypothetical protein [Microlunatus parietis]NYE74677.1 hypothetical protein [Microlunatus parietis]
MRRVKDAGVVVLAAVLSSLLVACGTTVRVDGAKVDSNVPYLSVLEQAWRDGSASDKYAQLAKETHCWLLRDPSTEALQPRALCGPIRHLSDEGAPGVFDELRFEPKLEGDGQVSVDASTISVGQTGIEPPGGVELYRPDGKAPLAADQVPMPEAPRADRGVVALGDDELLAGGGVPAKNNVIYTPSEDVKVVKFGRVPRLQGGGDAPYYDPAENEEFLAITVEIDRQDGGDETIESSRSYSVRVDGKIKSITENVRDASQATIVASVPIGKDAELIAGVAGLDQTISFRTGERTSKTAAGWYREKSEFDLNKSFDDRVKVGQFECRHRVTFVGMEISAYDRLEGWAPDGQMWVYLDWVDRLTETEPQVTQAGLYQYKDAKIAATGSVAVTVDGRAAGKVVKGEPASEGWNIREGRVLLQVPDSAKEIEITYGPKGTFQARSYTDPSPRNGSFSFTPITFGLSLS